MRPNRSLGGQSPSQVKHKTLSAYYDNLKSLASHFDDCPTLRREGDPRLFEDFLENTICAIISSDPIPKMPWYGIAEGSQQEAIDRVLVDLSSWKRGSEKNVLIMGDRKSSDLPVNIYKPGVECRHIDSPAAILRQTPWQILRGRIGDGAFRHLLLYTSVFLPVGNNCFMQLSGIPVYDLNNDMGRVSIALEHCSRKRKRASKPGCTAHKRRKAEERGSVYHPTSKTGQPSPADNVIARPRMFYGNPSRKTNGKIVPGLHGLHILNQIKASEEEHPDDASCQRFLIAIFPKCASNKRKCSAGETSKRFSENPRREPRLLGMARQLWARHHRLDYAKSLRLCLTRAHDHTIDGLQPVSHSQVCRFITNIFRCLLPATLSGSQHNLQTLCHHARKFVRAKQFEPTTLHHIMQDLRINDFEWVAVEMVRVNPAELKKRRELVEQFVLWLFDDYLISLLKNTFYITETAQTRYETVYFSHDDWLKASTPHFHRLKEDHLERLSKEETAFALQGPLGVSAVRLIPKPNGFRPIVNLGRRLGGSGLLGLSMRGAGKGMSANQTLRGVHQVLTYEKDRKRDILGSALFGTNEIFAPIQVLRNEIIKIHGKIPRLYFIKMDIKAAFDTIKQDKMMEVVMGFIDQDHDYILMLYCLLLPPASQVSQGSGRRLFKTRAVADDGQAGTFEDLARDIAQPLRNALIIDLARRKDLSRSACLQLLHTHIQKNVWQIGNKYFRQKEGIPQGSKISSILCSIFYAALERDHLSYFSKPGSRLLRYIDDFLYITDDYSLARRFISTMSKGFPEYGAFISPNKTLVSFEWARDGHVAPFCAPDTQGLSYFPFCGFLIDCQTLEMGMDTPRMLAGDMKQSFALRFARHRGAAFVGWLSRQLENRNHVAYLDTIHNSIETVHLNIWLNFASTIMKLPHYFDSSEQFTQRMSKLIYDSIVMSIGYTYIAGRARVRHAARWDEHPSRHYTIRKKDFEFLAKSAVISALRRKAGRFRDVIHLLQLDLDSREYRTLHDRFADVIRQGRNEVRDARY